MIWFMIPFLPEGISSQCLPDSLAGREYYIPSDQGLEPRFAQRNEQIKAWKEEHRKDAG